VNPSFKKFLRPALALSAAAGFVLAASGIASPASTAARPTTTVASGNYAGDKVTICHRTNAINNPYVEIEIDVSAILGPSGHGPQNTNHNVGTGIFDPDFDYPNNAKDWQDIIPPFDYTLDGVAASFEGYNWSAAGQLIWENGCDGYARVTTTTSGGGSTTTTTDGEDSTVPDDEDSTTTTTEPLPRNGVRVTVYVDLNNNCQQDDDEPTVPLVSVTVAKGGQTYTLITDENGTVVEGPLPGGNYTGSIDESPSGLDVTCTDEDSTRVPGNGIGDIKIGLRGEEEIEITIDTPNEGDPLPPTIIINYCGEDEICDNDDDFEFEVEIDEEGKFNGAGLPGGRYTVRPAGTDGVTYEAIEFTLSPTSQSLTITPETVPEAALANSGSSDTTGKLLAIVFMLLAGASVMFARRRTEA